MSISGAYTTRVVLDIFVSHVVIMRVTSTVIAAYP